MVKFLIQDIIPNERRRNPTGDRRRATTPRRDTDMGGTRPVRHEQHTEKPLVHHHAVKPDVIEGVDTRVVHHAKVETISNPPIENPRTMIVDSVESPMSDDEHDDAPPSHGAYFDDSPIEGYARGRADTYHTRRSTPWMNWLPWTIGSVLFTALVVLLLNYIGGATVTVFPKKETATMDEKITAMKNPTNGELSFSVMKVSLEESREVPATGEKTLTAKASGSIIIYNTQTVALRLIKNTRFQSPSGKIYRINDSVNVPKATTKAGKVTPGSIGVVVYADEAGPDYNTGATDFTLPGLKGSPTFEKVYARGKGAITGGASGTIKTVSDMDMKKASDDLRVQLETKLRTKARGDLAPSQLSFDSGITIEMGDPALSKAPASTEDAAVVTLSGTLYMLTFHRDEFTKELVGKLIKEYKGETVSITNIESMVVTLPEQSGKEMWEAERIEFSVKGTPNLEWSVDTNAISKALVGMPKESFKSVMTQFPTVGTAMVKISPKWKHTFPKKQEDIEIKIGIKEGEK